MSAPATTQPDAMPAVTSLRSKDLLGIADLAPNEISLILDTTEAMKEIGSRPIKQVPALRGKTVVNLFFEPSTRTRASFEIAERRLSADTLSIAVASSSVVKGETLADTALNLEAMQPDMIVLRHASSGACHMLSRICRSAIINAGDGMHEHPTQALLDAFTIRERKKRLAGLKVAIIGDLLHSRVLRSNIHLLTKMGADVWVCGPPTLIPTDIARFGVRATSDVDEAAADADVIMLLRLQLERMQGAFFPSLREYFNVFGMTEARLRLASPDVIIIHPGPMNRGVEISSEVAGLDEGRQVLVGGGDDADVDVIRACVTYRLDLTLLNDPKQLGLKIERKVTDLIQEDRSTVCGPEETRRRGIRTGESALRMTHELALNELR